MRNREKGTAVDYVGYFEREAAAFEAAARRAAGVRAAPDVPSCPDWVVTDLVLHLGMVHRLVARLVGEQGERFAFRRTEGPETWAVRFDGEAVRLGEDDGQDDRQDDSQDDGQDDGGPSIQISGTASDLALFLWQRSVTGRLDVRGDSSLLERYFVLVPPL